MYEGFWRDTILNNLTVPLIVVLFGAIIAIVQHYANKFVKMFTERQKVESVEKIASARSKLVAEIDTATEGAVASTMDMVDKLKEGGKKLDEEQIKNITDSAKAMVYLTIPKTIGGMSVDEILGSANVVDDIINVSLEKYVLEYKIKRGKSGTNPTVLQPEPEQAIDPVCDPEVEYDATNTDQSESINDGISEQSEPIPEDLSYVEHEVTPVQDETPGFYVAPPITDTGGISLI